jgi:hypothetical protein
MASPRTTPQTLTINRAPVLTLWAAVVAERLGFAWHEALTLGRAVAGLNAYSKGTALGLFTPVPQTVTEKRQTLHGPDTLTVALLHRAVPVRRTTEGLRALSKDTPIDPDSVQRYLTSKFGEAFAAAAAAMRRLARSRPPADLADEAYQLYEQFRPEIPAGKKGWGAAGTLDLEAIRQLAAKGHRPA